MSDKKEDGVIDQNCKVFDIENLYIAGRTTFPTGGSTNPTLNIDILSLRIAHHLKHTWKV